jgi:hypothetical protein
VKIMADSLPPIFFFFLIVVIYLIAQLVKRWIKMPKDEYATLQAVVELFVAWSVIFFGVWTMPLDNVAKSAFDVANTIFFVSFGLAYFINKGKIHIPQAQTKIQNLTKGKKQVEHPEINPLVAKFFMIFGLILGISISIMFFGIAISYWESVSINSIQVITYRDLEAIFMGGLGLFMLVATFFMFKDLAPELNNLKKSRK